MPALLHETLAPDFPLFNADQRLPPSSSVADAVAYALQTCPGFNFLPSNHDSLDSFPSYSSPATAHFSCNDFRMYEFKVRRCMRGRSHDWTECPFAHPGEKARRRDPRRIHYSGSPCPDFRKGSCRRGDVCEFAHGVFECWLHPARYRTQVCKDGRNCKRRVCFFAHSQDQLRILPASTACTNEKTDEFGVHSSCSSIKESSDNQVFLPSAVGMSKACRASASSPLHSPTPSPVEVSRIRKQLDSIHAFMLRQAMAQDFLACQSGYGVNFNGAEYCPSPDGYAILSEAQMMLNTQPMYIRNCSNESLCSKFNQPQEKSSYDQLAGHSHGLASPTSTLAGHVFSPPPSSPPLSPLISPNINQTKVSFSNPVNDRRDHNVDGTATHLSTCNPTYMCKNLGYMEDLGYGLQNLLMAHNNDGGFASQNSCVRQQAGQASIHTPRSRQPLFKHLMSNLLCTSPQALWGTSIGFASSESRELDLLRVGDTSGCDFGASRIGEESTNMDNLAPDFGWVSELVK